MSLLRALTLLALPAALSACAHHQPVWSEQTVAHISGKAIQGLSPEESRRQMLARAARATVDHGYRYFALMNASPSAPTLQPGADLVIHMLSAKESGRKGALDAYRLLEARTNAR